MTDINNLEDSYTYVGHVLYEIEKVRAARLLETQQKDTALKSIAESTYEMLESPLKSLALGGELGQG